MPQRPAQYVVTPSQQHYRAYLRQHALTPSDCGHIRSGRDARGLSLRSEQVAYYGIESFHDDEFEQIMLGLRAAFMRSEPVQERYLLTITDSNGNRVVERFITEDQLTRLPA